MSTPTFRVGSVEYLRVTVTADVTLDAQPVELSMDRGVTWLPATWVGDAGTSRLARTSTPVTFADKGSREVLVRLTDVPEVPLFSAGSISVI